MNQILLGNIISLGACAVMAAIGLIKQKKHILWAQCAQFSLFAAANMVLGGYTGVVANAVSILRNIVCLKLNYTWPLKLLFMTVQVVLSVAVNDAGLLGWLPLVAAILFTIFLDLRNPIHFKLLVIVTQALWVIYDYFMCNYVSCSFDVLALVTNAIGIIRIKLSPPEATK